MNALQRLKDADIRERPSEALIQRIRQQYPTETEVDAVLTRKMHRRNGPAFQTVSLEKMLQGCQQLIETRLGYPVTIEGAKWLSGGASKLQAVFTLQWRGPDGGPNDRVSSKMVLRTEPAASVTESSRKREFQVLKAVAGAIPAPVPYWIDATGEFLPYPGIIYSFCTGVAKPSTDSGKVSGLGQNYGPGLRSKLAPQFVGMLATLHRMDGIDTACLTDFDMPVLGSNEAVIKQVNAVRRIWEEDRLEEEPIMEVVYKWLIKHAPPIDHISLIHGDYRSGNFLFDEASGEITTWLDWEGAVLGDRHRDLTYACMDTFSHIAEDGVTPLAAGMLPRTELYAAYEKASGLKVDPKRLTYYKLFNHYLIVALILGASARSSYGARTHQDVLTHYVTGIGYPSLAEICDYFQEAVQ
ncbi:phosphotransferase family protein [Spongiibacter taiwanensis]|uniref:phosphotransferase family protein n=1 Tax=Spongiibacter taiwanensis TaxID=1748242 RepID=UPI0020364443|nr:phosphotransferase family protein [Spongiibacter taiwanensis]USA42447.1 phosphotransferase family protein [Spongiibacter taiwanensis]